MYTNKWVIITDNEGLDFADKVISVNREHHAYILEDYETTLKVFSLEYGHLFEVKKENVSIVDDSHHYSNEEYGILSLLKKKYVDYANANMDAYDWWTFENIVNKVFDRMNTYSLYNLCEQQIGRDTQYDIAMKLGLHREDGSHTVSFGTTVFVRELEVEETFGTTLELPKLFAVGFDKLDEQIRDVNKQSNCPKCIQKAVEYSIINRNIYVTVTYYYRYELLDSFGHYAHAIADILRAINGFYTFANKQLVTQGVA